MESVDVFKPHCFLLENSTGFMSSSPGMEPPANILNNWLRSNGRYGHSALKGDNGIWIENERARYS